MLRSFERLITLFTSPKSTNLRYLLIALSSGTGWIGKIVGLDVHYGSPSREVLRTIRHPISGLLDVVQALELVVSEAHRRGWVHVRMRMEIGLGTLGVVPASQVEAFLDIRIDLHGARANHGERTAFG